MQSFCNLVNALRTDGESLISGTLNTKSGRLLNENSVIIELKKHKEERETAEKE